MYWLLIYFVGWRCYINILLIYDAHDVVLVVFAAVTDLIYSTIGLCENLFQVIASQFNANVWGMVHASEMSWLRYLQPTAVYSSSQSSFSFHKHSSAVTGIQYRMLGNLSFSRGALQGHIKHCRGLIWADRHVGIAFAVHYLDHILALRDQQPWANSYRARVKEVLLAPTMGILLRGDVI